MERQKERDNDSSAPALPSIDPFDVVTGSKTKDVEVAMPASEAHRTPSAHLVILCGGVDSVSKNTGSCENPLCKSPSRS